eukprot:76438-Pyramimonas_sp.AAC.1
MKLPNMKSGPVLKWRDPDTYADPEQRPPSEGAVAELWKLALPMIQEPVLGVFRASQAFQHVPQRVKNGETVSLRKPKGDGTNARDHYRTINLIGHLGKGF